MLESEIKYKLREYFTNLFYGFPIIGIKENKIYISIFNNNSDVYNKDIIQEVSTYNNKQMTKLRKMGIKIITLTKTKGLITEFDLNHEPKEIFSMLRLYGEI